MKKPLPVIQEPASSVASDGSRNYVHPADVTGRFQTLRKVVFVVLILVYLALPFINVGGKPAVFLDVMRRRFYLFGFTFNAQDFWLAFFVLTGIGFTLFVVTTLFGRIWCGYACPHTVFLEGVFRPIERLIEGPRNVRMKRNAGPMTFDKLWRKVLKHLLFVAVALFISHFVLSYFVSLPSLWLMVGGSPSAHPEAFAWMAAMTLVIYFNFAWFREQLCLAICPYGRLQSALIDNHSIVIGYDEARGEPRGKPKDPEAGDCIDCKRCVVVCPTGIDIRVGLQMECIGCAACVDACDEIMDKLGRERGLVRYDSLNGLVGKTKKFIRPRLFFYAFLGVLGLVVATLSLRTHQPIEANVLRNRTPFVVVNGEIRNSFQLHVVNKSSDDATFDLEPVDADVGLTYIMPLNHFSLRSLADQRVPVIVSRPEDAPPEVVAQRIRIRVTSSALDEPMIVEAPFVAPR